MGGGGAAEEDEAAPVGFVVRAPGGGGKYVESNPGLKGAEGTCCLTYGSCLRTWAAVVLPPGRPPGSSTPCSLASSAAISQSASSRSFPGLLMSKFAEIMSLRVFTPSIVTVFELMTSMSVPGYFASYKLSSLLMGLSRGQLISKVDVDNCPLATLKDRSSSNLSS